MAVDSPERLSKDLPSETQAIGKEKQNSINKNTDESKTSSKSSESNPSIFASTSRDTNSSDPESVRCRVFIGNLNTDKINRDEFRNHFLKFGKVLGCSLHMNFGFIQFGTPAEADQAVAEMHGTNLFGKRIDANIASERRRGQGKDKKDDSSFSRGRSRKDRMNSPVRFRSRSPRSPRSRYDELYHHDDVGNRSYKSSSRTYLEDQHPRLPYDRPDSYSQQNEVYGKDYYRSEHAAPNYGKKLNADTQRHIDCEIIASSAELRVYANSIESRLHAMGISANIMFPPPEIPLHDIVDRVARDGCLYAIAISTQNDYHQSCTLNILHGAPQEHRNMPLDDALAFVARNFNQYLSDSKEHGAAHWSTNHNQDGPSGKTILTQDAYISGILNMAAAGKPLKVLEVNHLIEALIKYKSEIEIDKVNQDKQHHDYKDSESYQQGHTQSSILHTHYTADSEQLLPNTSNQPAAEGASPYIGYPGYLSVSKGF